MIASLCSPVTFIPMAYNEKLEDYIDHYLIDNEELFKNKTMGWVGWLLNGNMCFGIYDDLLIVRLNNSLAHALVQKPGIERFRQDEDTAGMIISIESGIYENQEALRKFIDESMEYTGGLPPKEEDDDLGIDDLGLDDANLGGIAE